MNISILDITVHLLYSCKFANVMRLMLVSCSIKVLSKGILGLDFFHKEAIQNKQNDLTPKQSVTYCKRKFHKTLMRNIPQQI